MAKKIYLEITNRCNLSCRFCPGTTRPAKSLTDTEFEFLTDRLSGFAPYLYFHLMGEPLSHPHLPLFITRAAQKGFRPMLTTNGTLLSAHAKELLDTPLYKISISLHAAAANPAFEDPHYLDSCSDFACKAAEKGIIVVFRLWNLGDQAEDNGEILSRLHTFFPEPTRKIRTGECLLDRIFLEWGQHFEWPCQHKKNPVPADTPIFCRGLRDQLGVLSDGTVVPCCLDAEGALALGNLFKQTLPEILSAPRAAALYRGFTARRAVEPLCRECDFARLLTH